MDGITLAGLAADPMDIVDAAEDLVMLAGAAVFASEGLRAIGGGDNGFDALTHLLQKVRDAAEALAATAGNRSPRWLVS
jgi:hypothetical protein